MRPRALATAWLAAALALSVSAGRAAGAAPVFDAAYFGIDLQRATAGTVWTELEAPSVRLHDANVTWADLQPTAQAWRWERLDAIVDRAGRVQARLLLPLQATPIWASARPQAKAAYGDGAGSLPRDPHDWDAYVDAVARRYAGRIEAYEVWNEPNLKQFFDDTPAALGELTRRTARIIRAADPRAKVVCSGVTGSYGIAWLRDYLKVAGSSCDVIGYHFYTSHRPPEAMVPIIADVRGVMKALGLSDKPLWNTETGWLIDNGDGADPRSAGFGPDVRLLSSRDAMAYVARALVLARWQGVDRFYWYSWDHQVMGLSGGRGARWAPPARAFLGLRKWLAGATIERCNLGAATTSCDLRLASGQGLTMLWSDPGATHVAGGPMKVWRLQDDGTIAEDRDVGRDGRVRLDALPVWVSRDAR